MTKKPKLPPISKELYEMYPSMSAQTHEDAVKDYARSAVEAALSTDAEPVAYYYISRNGVWHFIEANEFGGETDFIPLYAAPPAPSVAVKALDWKAHDDGINHIAIGAFGMDIAYIATSEGWRRFSEKWVALDGLDASRAAAQADYENRIRSALSAVPTPLQPEPPVT